MGKSISQYFVTALSTLTFTLVPQNTEEFIVKENSEQIFEVKLESFDLFIYKSLFQRLKASASEAVSVFLRFSKFIIMDCWWLSFFCFSEIAEWYQKDTYLKE